MSQEGTTTEVLVKRPKVSPVDRTALCTVICKCNKAPDVGADGRSLKQACVSKTLNAADKAAGYKSWYKAEVNYDMTKRPPEPIMASAPDTKVHDWLPGWLNKWWSADEAHPPFKPGTGLIRRPDLVIVSDPTRPPTQDNIKQIVEIKFPPDPVSEQQLRQYARIAGDPNKVTTLEPDECDCDNQDPQSGSGIKVPDAKSATLGAMLLLTLGIVLAPVGM
jgi:hypothetical protein